MTTEEKRIAIAQACGWVDVQAAPHWKQLRWVCYTEDSNGYPDDIEEGDPIGRHNPKAKLQLLPDYLNDLNAMHEAERTLSADNKTQDQWWEWLKTVCSRDCAGSCTYAAAHATAAQRADAFLLTLNLMKP